MNRSAGLLLCAAAFAAGCNARVDVPEGLLITCSAEAPCPEGFECTRAGLCVRLGTADRTPPDLVRIGASPAGGRAGTRFEISLEVSEPLRQAPAVIATLAQPVTLPCEERDSLHHVCTYTAVGEEFEGRQGTVLLDVRLEDVSGNTRSVPAAASFALDFVPPSIIPVAPLPAVAGLGQTVVVTVRPTEPTTLARFEAAGPGPLDFQLEPLSEFVLSHVVTAADRDGEYRFTVDLEDAAGNPAPGLLAGTFRVDAQPPVLGAIRTDAPVYSAADGHRRVTATFTCDESLDGEDATLLVTLGGEEMECGPWDSEARAYRCTFDLTDRVGHGSHPLAVTAMDGAGNIAAATTTVRVDRVAPALVPNPIEPASARAGAVVVVSLRPLEPVLEPRLAVAGPAPLVFARDGESDWVWTAVVAPDQANGRYVVHAELEDEAGNKATHEVGAFEVDTGAPEILHLATNRERHSAQPGFDEVVAAVRLSEPVPDGSLAATVGPEAMHCTATPERTDWTCRLSLSADSAPAGTEFARHLLVRAEDAAGNEATARAVVVYDFRPPQLRSASVAYVPEGSVPIRDVRSAKAGTRIRVDLVADEPLAGDPAPTLVATSGAGTLSFARVDDPSGAGLRFEATVETALPDGEYLPALSFADLAGNTVRDLAFAPSPAIQVKTARPVLLVAQGSLTYVRSPRGNAAAENLGPFTMPANAYFALAPSDPLAYAASLPPSTFTFARDEPVLVRLWSDSSATSLSATLARGSDGWPRARLGADAPKIWATGVNDAGAESLPVLIENVEWVATSNVGAGPHAVKATPAASESASHDLALTVDAGTVAKPDGSSLLAEATPVWRQRSVGSSPAAREGAAAAYDTLRGRFVVFGGLKGSAPGDDTWEWDGRNWTEVTTSTTRPPARHGHSMTYDPERARVVLFGGTSGSNVLADTWEWDGAQWLERSPASAIPPARSGHAVVFDHLARAVVLFGGNDGTTDFADLWTWDGSRWTARTQTGSADQSYATPSKRSQHAMAWDPERRRTYLFGGKALAGAPSAEMWELLMHNGVAMWWRREVLGDLPAARHGAATAFDHSRRVLVLSGGFDGTRRFDELWDWNGSSWRKAPVKLQARAGHVSAWDSVAKKVLVFGGRDAGGQRSDLVSWNDLALVDLCPSTGRPYTFTPRGLHYDPAGGRVLALSGASPLEIFEWNGTRWVLVPSTGAPSARTNPATAFDTVRRKLVLFGGSNLADTWEWDAATRAWENKTPASSPPGRSSAAMAFDAARGRVVMFGGSVPGYPGLLADTWEWDGTRWVTDSKWSGPWERANAAMACDPLRGRIVLYGGMGSRRYYADTWEWDGNAWVARTNSLLPPLMDGHTLAWDAGRRRIVMMGGYYQSYGYADKQWEWDGTNWTSHGAPELAVPPGRSGAGLAYDSARETLVLFGGSNNSGAQVDLWEHDDSPRRQPAIQFDVEASAAGFAVADLVDVRVRADCGGSFAPFGAFDNGANLLGWTTGEPLAGWMTLAANTGSNPSRIDWRASSAALAARLVRQRDLRLSFQCRPAGTSGTEFTGARVRLDYIEARFKYRVR